MRKLLLMATGLILGSQACLGDQWFVSYTGPNNSLMEIGYGTAGNQPQYAALDLSSCYLRMVFGLSSGWGTSIITMPSYWSGGIYHQGYPVLESHQIVGANLVLTLRGTSSSLSIFETITFQPPGGNELRATVQASVTGSVQLDNRAGEAFKPVMLSSMHDSGTSWDASAPFYDTTVRTFPGGGWIIAPNPPVTATQFGLLGGTSQWKTNAPTVTIALSDAMQIAGWLNTDNNPNDDNVGFWAASSNVVPTWTYEIIADNATAPAQIVHAGSFSMARGNRVSGGLSDLANSDDSRLVAQAGTIPFLSDYPVQIVVIGSSPTATPSRLRLRVEGQVQYQAIGQTIELYNYATNSFDTVDFRQGSLADQIVEVDAATPSQYVDPQTRQVKARLKYKPTQAVPNSSWRIGVDQVLWEITP